MKITFYETGQLDQNWNSGVDTFKMEGYLLNYVHINSWSLISLYIINKECIIS